MQALTASQKKIIAISSFGGGLEIYDFVIYIFFASIIAQLFFPSGNHFLALLATYGTFAAGYLARPIGGLLFGTYGDKKGRKQGLVISILVMGLGTCLVGVLPTYNTVGILAPILLVVLRLIQGLAVGGDLPGAMTFVAEHTDKQRRGLQCAWVFFGVNVGIVLASFVGNLISHNLTHDQVVAWGWRIGFLLSLILLVVGVYLRRRLAESQVFQQLIAEEKAAKQPIIEMFSGRHFLALLKGVGIVWLFAVIIAQIFLYMPAYLQKVDHVTMSHALFMNTLMLIVFSCLLPVTGLISDHIGRKPLLVIGSLCFIVFSYPIYAWMHNGGSFGLWAGYFCLSVFSSMIVGVGPAVLTEMFPTRFRYCGVAFSYNVGFAIFAGLTPLFVTWLNHVLSNPLALSYNLMLGGVVTLIAAISMHVRHKTSLVDL